MPWTPREFALISKYYLNRTVQAHPVTAAALWVWWCCVASSVSSTTLAPKLGVLKVDGACGCSMQPARKPPPISVPPQYLRVMEDRAGAIDPQLLQSTCDESECTTAPIDLQNTVEGACGCSLQPAKREREEGGTTIHQSRSHHSTCTGLQASEIAAHVASRKLQWRSSLGQLNVEAAACSMQPARQSPSVSVPPQYLHCKGALAHTRPQMIPYNLSAAAAFLLICRAALAHSLYDRPVALHSARQPVVVFRAACFSSAAEALQVDAVT
jgi:hypothetical protein